MPEPITSTNGWVNSGKRVLVTGGTKGAGKAIATGSCKGAGPSSSRLGPRPRRKREAISFRPMCPPQAEQPGHRRNV